MTAQLSISGLGRQAPVLKKGGEEFRLRLSGPGIALLECLHGQSTLKRESPISSDRASNPSQIELEPIEKSGHDSHASADGRCR